MYTVFATVSRAGVTPARVIQETADVLNFLGRPISTDISVGIGRYKGHVELTIIYGQVDAEELAALVRAYCLGNNQECVMVVNDADDVYFVDASGVIGAPAGKLVQLSEWKDEGQDYTTDGHTIYQVI